MEGSLDARTLVSRIADLLREQILRGDLAAGARIRQDEFAEVLGVSRTPLREAFRLLEAEGWVVSRPRAGVVVAGLSSAEVQEVSVMRLLLEPLAARAAATRHTAEAEDALAAIVQEEGSSPAGRSADHIEAVTRDFHFRLYGMPPDTARHDAMQTELRRYWERYARYRRVSWSAESQVAQSQEEHRLLLAAWGRRDGDDVERILAQHVCGAAVAMVRALDPQSRFTPQFEELAGRYAVDLAGEAQMTRRARRSETSSGESPSTSP
jgi:DNA-binding GntR family transcriptional regulator